MFQRLQNLLILLIGVACNFIASIKGDESCRSSICGSNGVNISYPFWSKNESTEEYCGYRGLGIKCSNGNPILSDGEGDFLVRSINYSDKSVRVVNTQFVGQTCFRPRMIGGKPNVDNLYLSPNNRYLRYFSKCSPNPPPSVPYLPCAGSNPANRSYVFEQDAVPDIFSWYSKCKYSYSIPVLRAAPNLSNNGSNYGSILELGTEMEWGVHSGHHYVSPWFLTIIAILILISGILVVTGAIQLIIYRRSISSKCSLMFCRWSTKNRKNFNVEAFFENYGHGPLALHRHTYSNLKKITNGFKDKLGQGGYGSVFKGKLRDGRLVAVKVLTESKGNGEDFVNEVAAISRTNHVNIVSLIGFCFERSKRALVYEYMPNGSLEKFIYDEKSPSSTHPLGWEKLHQIALGIANRLEYLHRGCTTRILHFDIKPHNILLDKDFCPKISDFGLAKLCPTRESTVSMHNARGTIGYIAPEVYCRNFGGVSSKSDVYSYGMMVLEMVGGRKNIDPTAKTSEIYFPQWIYNRLEQHGSVGLGEIDDSFEEESIRKMMIVGLWCIQTHPTTRPSMSMVIEMLQKPVEDLQMPPNPFQDPPTCTVEDNSSNYVQGTLTSTSSQSNL